MVLVTFAISSMLFANAQSNDAPIDRLQPLVEASAARLDLADQVALSKWDNGTPVDDAVREAAVIAASVRSGESQNLDSGFVADFFKAQIEANKVIQYALLAKWRRSGGPPPHGPVNLVTTVRPQLDRLQIALVSALAKDKEVRSSLTCKDELAKAVGRYLALHKHHIDALHAIALDRSLAGTCPQ